MNTVRKVQVGIAIGTIIVIGIVSAAIWYAPNPELEAQKAKVNLAANEFVDICMKSLPNGDSTCDINLRQQMQNTCETDSSYDICKDGRVEQYFKTRDQAISQNSNPSNDGNATPVGQTQESSPMSTLQDSGTTQSIDTSNNAEASPSKITLALQNVSIPSEQLLEICASDAVMSNSDMDARNKCNQMMNVMTLDYCQTNPPTQYAFTLCRDARYFKFYGIEPETSNLPSPENVFKIGQKTSIGGLQLFVVGYTAMNDNIHIFAEVNVTNNTPDNITLTKDNFAIIDEMGHVFDVPYVHINYPMINPEFNSKPLESIPAGTSYQMGINGMTSYYDNNILKVTMGNDVEYYALKKG